MAMDLSQFDESETCQLIDSILKEELEETGEENCNSIKVHKFNCLYFRFYVLIHFCLQIRIMKPNKC